MTVTLEQNAFSLGTLHTTVSLTCSLTSIRGVVQCVAFQRKLELFRLLKPALLHVVRREIADTQ